jgi:hypothetical protein
MSEEMRGRLRERHSEAARGAREKDGGGGCCDPSCCGSGSEARKAVLTEGSYSEEDLG